MICTPFGELLEAAPGSASPSTCGGAHPARQQKQLALLLICFAPFFVKGIFIVVGVILGVHVLFVFVVRVSLNILRRPVASAAGRSIPPSTEVVTTNAISASTACSPDDNWLGLTVTRESGKWHRSSYVKRRSLGIVSWNLASKSFSSRLASPQGGSPSRASICTAGRHVDSGSPVR